MLVIIENSRTKVDEIKESPQEDLNCYFWMRVVQEKLSVIRANYDIWDPKIVMRELQSDNYVVGAMLVRVGEILIDDLKIGFLRVIEVLKVDKNVVITKGP